MRRHVLVFSIRTAGEPAAVGELRERVEIALGCGFLEGSFNRTPALVTEILGMQVGLFGWRGRGGTGVIRLDGQLGESRLFDYAGDDVPEIDFIDIGRAVIDLLKVRGAGDWYVPDALDLQAEEAYGAQVERSFYAGPEE